MRILILIVLLVTFAACESSPGESLDKTDSVVDSVSLSSDSSSFLTVRNSVNHIGIPVLLSDSVSPDRGYRRQELDKHTCEFLLPADFEFDAYKSVSCFGESTLGDYSVLWIELVSDGEHDHSPDAIDVLMVIYDSTYQSLDVCNVATSGVGYSYSYVRADSIFTLEVDQVENINITTTSIAITDGGFIPSSSETHTFNYGKAGEQESLDFQHAYFATKGETMWMQ